MRGTDLKFSSVILRDSEGEQRFDAARLPLRLGTGTDCEIRLPGPGSSAVALLDELDGEPFVQPVGRGSNVTINGEPLVASRKLSVDDELGFFGSRIVIGQIDDAMLLNVRLEDSARRGCGATKCAGTGSSLADLGGCRDRCIAPSLLALVYFEVDTVRCATGKSGAPFCLRWLVPRAIW